jgi:hypothetical protein
MIKREQAALAFDIINTCQMVIKQMSFELEWAYLDPPYVKETPKTRKKRQKDIRGYLGYVRDLLEELDELESKEPKAA